jgi:hypothetical protein
MGNDSSAPRPPLPGDPRDLIQQPTATVAMSNTISAALAEGIAEFKGLYYSAMERQDPPA